VDLELSLEEAVFGRENEIRLPRAESCTACGGSGAASPSDMATCATCHGTGQQTFRQGFLTIARTCGSCHGAGRTIRKPCGECRGQGRVQRQRTLKVRIPPGVDSENRIRVRGEGEAGEQGGPPGDLYVILHVRDHPVFRREGRDLALDLPITFSQAALGAEIPIPLLGGARRA